LTLKVLEAQATGRATCSRKGIQKSCPMAKAFCALKAICREVAKTFTFWIANQRFVETATRRFTIYMRAQKECGRYYTA